MTQRIPEALVYNINAEGQDKSALNSNIKSADENGNFNNANNPNQNQKPVIHQAVGVPVTPQLSGHSLPINPLSSFIQSNPLSGLPQNPMHNGYYPPEYFEQPRGMPRTSFDYADFNTIRMQQFIHAQQQRQLMEKLNSSVTNDPQPTPTSLPQAKLSDDRLHQIYLEKESRWGEVRRFSEYIRRFANDAAHSDISKEQYYDLYNMAVCLLKAVDSLDPDKLQSSISSRKSVDFDTLGQMNGSQLGFNPGFMPHHMPLPQDLELMQSRKSFDFLYNNRGSIDGAFLREGTPMLYNNPNSIGIPNPASLHVPPMQTIQSLVKPDIKMQKTFSGELIFDDNMQQANGNSNNNNAVASQSQDDPRRPKRRRRRTVYSSRRNLHCHMCGVTETPEWRRGPAGDHTLCNACGLHYAKSLKKQKQDSGEGRKHSIDMLLNQSSNTSSTANTTQPTTET